VLSARGLDRIRRLARTIADLDTVDGSGGPSRPDTGLIDVEHVEEALLLRCQREYLLGSAQ
jgi:predicted ATPase with chaperone activity